MNIVLCHNYYQQPGGEDRVFHDEAELLESHGHQIARFTVHNDSIKGRSKLGVAQGTIWNRRAAAELSEMIGREQAQIVHFHNTLPLISPAAYYAARAAGAAVVQTLHNYRFLCPKATFFRNGGVCEECLGKWTSWPAVAHGCYRDSRSASAVVAAMLATHRALGTYTHAVDAYIACSEFSRSKLIEGGLPAEKITAKPNFVSPDPGTGTGQGGYAMYLGRLSPEKGVSTLLAAWEQVGDALPLKIVGDGPLAESVSEAAQRNPSVEWLEWQSNSRVQQIIGDACFLVLPSVNYEGFPKTIVEAFSKGTPVVASKLGAMAELIDDGQTGLHFEPGNSDDLASKVRQLAANPSQIASMRRAARRQYEQKYTAEANYPKLMAIYEQALDCYQATNTARRQSRPNDRTPVESKAIQCAP
jgi:glycosyltransferase involved in cell wall biosynthesis